ncbi:MAG: gamma-glutamylcyclotransferase [Proteobacteria bacterium]|nr:gamma-glutamylcyclotransferase [Pseudomonadota bacterium]
MTDSSTSAGYWVFGYGSLMWDPGFVHDTVQPARLIGYHRQFCLYSYRYRGTPERPGLVLGLDRGGSCRGVVYRVPDDAVAATKAYLWERELDDYAYLPKLLTVRHPGGTVRAQAFVVDRRQPQYARLEVDAIAAIIARGVGQRGSNRDYLDNTRGHLHELGIVDHGLERVAARVRALAGVPAPA